MKEKQIGRVSNYFNKIGVAAIKLDKPLRHGDRVRFAGGEVDFKHKVGSMQLYKEGIKRAKKGDEIGVKLPKGKIVRKGYRVYKI